MVPRPIGAGDIEIVARLHAVCFDDCWTAAAIARAAAGPGGFGCLVEAGGRAAGFALARVVAGEAEILSIGVIGGARRSGLGTALASAVAAVAAARGARRLFLEVAADNGPARALYRALGYLEVGCRRGYYARRGASAVDGLTLALALERCRKRVSRCATSILCAHGEHPAYRRPA